MKDNTIRETFLQSFPSTEQKPSILLVRHLLAFFSVILCVHRPQA